MSGNVGTSDAGADPGRSEFTKFCKFFTIRVVQVVVQSRTGGKVRTGSRVIGRPTDWFNANIDEVGEVNEELKRALDGRYLAGGCPVSLLISLRTIDGDTLHLEVWKLTLDTEQCDPGISVRSHFYHRLSVLLRSAIAASRVTPAYKLYARRQGPDSFVLRYQITAGPVHAQQVLGDGARTVDLGYVASPFGAVRLAVHYRTKMVISDNAVQLIGTLRENYYDTSTPLTVGSGDPAWTQCEHGSHQLDDSPWAPLPEPDAYKALPPLTDFSPTFSTFSTSPVSADFPFPSSPVRRASADVAVAFELGGGAASCSSSEEGPSGGVVQAGAIVPFRTSADGSLPKRNSSGTLFKMELSGAGAGGSTSPKPSSFPDNPNIITKGIRGSSTTIRRETSFPFAHLLSSNSAPNFAGGISGQLGQLQRYRYGSLTGGISTISMPTVVCKYSPKRRTVTAVMEEKQTESEENLESSREVMVADGVKIVEKRRTRKGKKREKGGNGEGDVEGNDNSQSESESSFDDSFVRYEMRPVFATGSDLGAFFNQCKSAPPDLKSFTVTFVRTLATTSAENAPTSETDPETVTGSLEEIPQHLKIFEEKQKSFDDFVKSLKVEEEDEEEGEEVFKGKNDDAC